MFDRQRRQMSESSFSFAGCGFLGIYHIGVAVCLRRHVPHMLKKAKFYGASAGAMIACCLMCEVPMNACVDFTLRLANMARSHRFGGFHPRVKISETLQDALQEVLPENAHIICTGRLFVSVTHWYTKENVIISDFPSRAHLIEALMMSAFVPIFSGVFPPQYKGEYYIDGGLSNNLPVEDESTILVSPFAGECDICPRDEAPEMVALTLANTSMQCSMDNLGRLLGALFPPSPGQLKDMCWAGFDDTVRYLSEHNLIRCEEHIVHAHLQHLHSRKDVKCKSCRRKIYYAHKDRLPDNIATMLNNPHHDDDFDDEDFVTLTEESRLWTRLLFASPVKALFKINVPIRIAIELWITAMIRFVSKVVTVGKKLYMREYVFQKMSFDTAWDLIRKGVNFLLASPIYFGAWCTGHEGETEDSLCESGESRSCKICKRPRIYGARTISPALPSAEEELAGNVPDVAEEERDATSREKMVAASASTGEVSVESECGASGATSASAHSWNFSRLVTPESGASSGAQGVEFDFSMEVRTHTQTNGAEPSFEMSAQCPLAIIHETVEEIHVENVKVHPLVTADQEEHLVGCCVPEETDLPPGQVGASCPQALDSFEACLEAFEDMEAILTLHYMDDDMKMHSETIFGAPTYSQPHSHNHSMFEEDSSDEEELAASGVASVAEETWDDAVSHSTVVRHELMDIIQEKILQQEMDLEERRRLALKLHGQEPEDIGHFSLKISGSLGADNLASKHHSLSTTFSASTMDIPGESTSNHHFLKSVSDASALASQLQALKKGSRTKTDAKIGNKSGFTTPSRLESSLSGRRSLENRQLSQSLLSLGENGQSDGQQTQNVAHSGRLVKAKSDGSGLAGKLHIIKKQDQALNHSVSADAVSAANAVEAERKPAPDFERSFVSETSRNGVPLSRDRKRRMRGKFVDKRFSQAQPSLDSGSSSSCSGASSCTHDTPASTHIPSASRSEPRPTVENTPPESRKYRYVKVTSSSAEKASQKKFESSESCYEEFSMGIAAQADASSKKEILPKESGENTTAGAQPRLSRSRSLLKCQDDLRTLRSDLESIKKEDGQSVVASSAEASNKASTNDGKDTCATEKEQDNSPSATGKKGSNHKHCRTS